MMKCKRFAAAFLCATCAAVMPGSGYPARSLDRGGSSPGAGRNVTGVYVSVFKSVKSGFNAAQLEKLSAFRILFVPGFLSNSLQYSPKAEKGPLGLIPTFFDEQLNWLRAQGLDAAIVPIESEAGIAHNAGLIQAAVKKSRKPVIMICHSKGGLDTLEGLLTSAAMRGKVKGAVFIQSPFYGSPIADLILKSDVSAIPAKVALQALGGSLKSLDDLAVKGRKDYQSRNADAILAVTSAIPVISFGSYKNKEKNRIDTVLKLFRDLMADAGIKNDGLVPVSSAMLPGSNKISVGGVDHAATVLAVAVPEFDRTRFIQTMLVMLLSMGLTERAPVQSAI